MKRILILAVLFLSTFAGFAQTQEFVALENKLQSQIKTGQWDEVLITALDLMVEDPTRGDGYYYTALAFYNMKQFNEAEENANNALAIADEALKVKVETLLKEIGIGRQESQISEVAVKKELSGDKSKAAEDWEELWKKDKT